MFFLILTFSGLAFTLILIIFQGEVVKDIYRRKQLRAMSEQERYRDEELEKSLVQRFVVPAAKGFRSGISRLASRTTSRVQRNEANKERMEAVELQMRQAGFKMAVHEFMLLKSSFVIFILVIGLVIGMRMFLSEGMVGLLFIAAALMGSIALPRFFISSKIKGRQKQIQLDMPNIMDLLSVSIEAGLGFDAALYNVIQKFTGPLTEELLQVYKEIKMGRARRDALAMLAKRNTTKELQMFVSAVIQSEQYGTPIKAVLKVQSEQLREDRRKRAQEKAMKAPVKMMIPMLIFIFPVIFIIILGPTVINVIQEFAS